MVSHNKVFMAVPYFQITSPNPVVEVEAVLVEEDHSGGLMLEDHLENFAYLDSVILWMVAKSYKSPKGRLKPCK